MLADDDALSVDVTLHLALDLHVTLGFNVVQGSILGNAVAFQSSSHVEADVVHKSLVIEQGAFFEGRSIRSEHPMSLLRTANGVSAAA